MPANLLFIALLLVGLLFFAVVIWIKFFPREIRAGDGPVYELWKTILTPAERSFAGALEKSLPDGVRLLAKVRLGDIFFIRRNLAPSRRASARNRISQKHVDFLLVRASDFAPLAGLELDDQSHAETDRQQRDRFVDQVFAAGNLPLIHVTAASDYQVGELRTKVETALLAADR
jgi:hypothetical protein